MFLRKHGPYSPLLSLRYLPDILCSMQRFLHVSFCALTFSPLQDSVDLNPYPVLLLGIGKYLSSSCGVTHTDKLCSGLT